MDYFSPYENNSWKPLNYDYMRQHYQIIAYSINIPIYINGENINQPPYSALNFHPQGVQPSVYIPVSHFSKAGATVQWDESTQTINVTANDEQLVNKLISLAAWRMAYGEISKAVETQEQQARLRYNGMVDDKFVFDGVWWYGAGGDSPSFTVGKYYSAYTDFAGMSQIYLNVTNDQGGLSYFRRSTLSFDAEGITAPNISTRQQMYNPYMRQPQQIYAYPIDIPIYIQGKNINKLPYKALNYHPVGAQPAVYVPVSQFTKLGAIVHWYEQAPSIVVRTDEMLEDKLTALVAWRMAYGEISKAVETQEQQARLRYNGMVDDKFVFDGVWWHGHGIMNRGILGDDAALAATLTVGKYYNANTEGAAGRIYLNVTNDQGGQSAFYRSSISLSDEGVPIP